jgi:hypothetical protein
VEFIEQRSPDYMPARWNDQGARQHANGSYDYACDRLRDPERVPSPPRGAARGEAALRPRDCLTDAQAQPGRAGGLPVLRFERAALHAAALADGLVPSDGEHCGCDGPCWQRVALVLWPGQDFHWYRQDRDGRWSHKPGGGPATNLDSSGRPIVDPRTADRGPYQVFCGFYCLRPARVQIR